MSMDRIIREEARYIVLRALNDTPDYTLSDALLERFLEEFGIRRSREFVRSELSYLADIGAVTVKKFETTSIAKVTQRGRDHVARKIVLDGVKRPNPEGE